MNELKTSPHPTSSTVIVTGAGGFLGSHLCERFLQQNYCVIGIDNFCTGLRSNKTDLEQKYPQNLIFLESDITLGFAPIKNQIPADWLKNLKFIFHFASPASPPHYQKLGLETLWVNTMGLSHCLSFADQNNARVVFASTSEVYGDPAISPQPETYWGNVNSFGERSCYDEAKRFGEALIFTHNKKHQTKHGLVRIFNTYGPRMNPNDGRVVINFILQALKNQDITIYGDGKQTRSFCYVDDLIRGIQLYAESMQTAPINLGNDKEFNMLELAQMVLEQLQTTSRIIYQPLPADDPKQRRPDLTLARKHLGYQPSIPLKDGVIKTAQWLKEIQ